VLGLQRTHGNAHVAGLLIQRADPVVGTEEQKRLGEIRKVMEATATGREGLEVLDKHQVKVVFSAAGEKFYDPAANTITLDPNASAVRAALTLVHELHHARCEKEGLGADATKLSRDEYVKLKVEEEADGTIESIEAKTELLRTQIDVSDETYPLEREYRDAYNAAVQVAWVTDRTISEEEMKKIGREAGRARVLKAYADGEIVGNRSGMKYPQLYGELWDQLNR
jgi:hypothetical protein